MLMNIDISKIELSEAETLLEVMQERYVLLKDQTTRLRITRKAARSQGFLLTPLIEKNNEEIKEVIKYCNELQDRIEELRGE